MNKLAFVKKKIRYIIIQNQEAIDMYYLDMHCDTITALLRNEYEDKESSLRKNDLHIDLERMKKK